MKLLRRKVEKLEKASAAGSSRPIAIVWTRDNEELPEDVELAPGEHVARDVHVLAKRDWAKTGQPSEYRIVERIAAGEDWGGVFDWRGLPVGRVLPAAGESGGGGEFIDLEWFEGADVPDAPDPA